MERAGGVEKDAHLHTHPLLQSRLKELSVSLRVGVERPTKKAPQTTIALLMAFELTVMDERRPDFPRMYAWYRLVRCWSAMRFDDHRGMAPRLIRLGASGLRATLVQTKTTGAGKKKEQLE